MSKGGRERLHGNGKQKLVKNSELRANRNSEIETGDSWSNILF